MKKFVGAVARTLTTAFLSGILWIGGIAVLAQTTNPATRVWVTTNFCALTGCTMAGDLLFTDATYDIGKSGATRPRDGFFSRNITGGGDITVPGGYIFTGSSSFRNVTSSVLSARNGASTASVGFTASYLRVVGPGNSFSSYTVATLPASGNFGRITNVSDGDAGLAWGDTVVNTGAGATQYLVWDNGTNWTILGK